MKIIIFGCGKIGTTIIESLVGEGHDIVAVDNDSALVEEVANIYDIMGLCGNGVDSDTMREAGCETADLFIAVTGSDELNMLGCFLARKMGTQNTVARIRNPEYNDDSLVFMKNQLDLSMALNPDKLTAHEIYNILRFPSAASVETFSGRGLLEIVHIALKEDSPFVGLSLWELRKKHQERFLVCDVERDGDIYIPGGSFVMNVGDIVGITAPHSEIQKLLKNMGMPQKLPDSVMIAGGSRIAYYLAKKLLSAGITVKIVEQDKGRCSELSKVLPGVIMIHGDAMQQDVLLEEGLADVDAFVTATGRDEKNILSAFMAMGQNVPIVIAKVNRPELASTAENLGLVSMVSPRKTVAAIISRYARALENSLGSNVETLYKLLDGKAEVLEFKVRADFEYANISLRDMKLKKNILVAGITRGKKPIIPSGEDVIMPGDKVIVLAAGHQLGDLSDIVL